MITGTFFFSRVHDIPPLHLSENDFPIDSEKSDTDPQKIAKKTSHQYREGDI